MTQDRSDAVLDKIVSSPRLLERMAQRMRDAGLLILASPASGEDALARMRSDLAGIGFTVLKDAMMHDLPPPGPDRVPTMCLGLVDVETTSRDKTQGRIIQMTIHKLLADEKGPISLVEDGVLDLFNDPGEPIPREITVLTGITDAMVKGKRIDIGAVDAFCADIDRFVAHNARFDYGFIEYHMPDSVMVRKPWFCTFQDVRWEDRGIFNRTLGNIMKAKGYSFKEHDSLCDTRALAFIMAAPDPVPSGRSVFEEMVATAGDPAFLVIARNSPFNRNPILKNHGFIFNNKEDQHGIRFIDTWFKPIDRHNAEETAAVLREVFGNDRRLPVIRTGLMERFSAKKPPAETAVEFDTADPLALFGAPARGMDLLVEDDSPGQGSLI